MAYQNHKNQKSVLVHIESDFRDAGELVTCDSSSAPVIFGPKLIKLNEAFSTLNLCAYVTYYNYLYHNNDIMFMCFRYKTSSDVDYPNLEL